tara:strand:- start:9 stop:206 length:198 start_codon:yes stop_codon:yes gene_type:complete
LFIGKVYKTVAVALLTDTGHTKLEAVVLETSHNDQTAFPIIKERIESAVVDEIFGYGCYMASPTD